MLALATVVAAAIVLTPLARAQDGNYTVWSTVVLTRTGERTPELIDSEVSPTRLTTLGADQAFAAGSFFRDRYITLPASQQGAAGAPLRGLNPDLYSSSQTYAFTLDEQWNSASAQAFMQGFYPAVQPNTTTDPSAVLSNSTYVSGPLGGYQYAQIHTPALLQDPNSLYLGASSGCGSWNNAAYASLWTEAANATAEKYDSVYAFIGNELLGGVLPSDTWISENAYLIYDYLSFQYTHGETAERELDATASTGTSYISLMKELADAQMYAQFGDMNAYNEAKKTTGLPGNVQGSISTIAGNYLAEKVLIHLADALIGGDTYYPLNLLFADFEPFVSFFALSMLPTQSSDFYGLPNFAASMVFELYSLSDNSVTTIPSEDELYVRFLFRNGSDASDEMLAYSLFNLPKSEYDMQWTSFVQLMDGIRLGGEHEWCEMCGVDRSSVRFCPETLTRHHHSGLSPVVAGVIGAMVTLAVAALLFGAVMLIGGVRLHRNGRRKSDLGGFKGGQKMASDQDLSIPKGGAVVGAAVERHVHERTGSWELKQSEAGRDVQDVGALPSAWPSMEQIRPVQPHERV